MATETAHGLHNDKLALSAQHPSNLRPLLQESSKHRADQLLRQNHHNTKHHNVHG